MLKNLTAWRLLNGASDANIAPRRAFVLALLDIYKRYGVYIGGRLEYADLVREWPAAGFRRGDLETGLDEAIDAGLLAFADDTFEPAVTLLSDLPDAEPGTLVLRLRHKAADRTLQLQRAHRHNGGEWNGDNRRRGSGATAEA